MKKIIGFLKLLLPRGMSRKLIIVFSFDMLRNFDYIMFFGEKKVTCSKIRSVDTIVRGYILPMK